MPSTAPVSAPALPQQDGLQGADERLGGPLDIVAHCMFICVIDYNDNEQVVELTAARGLFT